MPWLLLNVCEQERIWIINVNLLDVLGDRTTGGQLACHSIKILETCNWGLFESWRHDDWDRVAMTIDILLIRLAENLRTWTDFSKIRNLNWRWFASLPSINRVEPLDGNHYIFKRNLYFKVSLICLAGSPCLLFTSSLDWGRKMRE